ncbi:MAG: CPBP family intramembrane metalloprotease [Nitrospirae bacterium]|nr:CPBP family intramembrane metalloprotease [Nitrospirota bacterium]
MKESNTKVRQLILVLKSFLILMMSYSLLWVFIKPLFKSNLPDALARSTYLLFASAISPLIAGLYIFLKTGALPKIIVKRNMFYAVLTGMVGSWLTYKIRRHLGVAPALPGNSIYDLAKIFIVVLWAPFFEETLFRGYFLEILKLKWNNIGALLLSSFLFTLPHLFNMTLISLYGIMFLGFSMFADSIIFGVVYLQGGLIAAIVVHALSNCYEFF